MVSRQHAAETGREHGTPLFVVDHEALRKNYETFKKYLPRVQAYYAVKANSDPAIVQTLYEAGASFDVASMAEFRMVYENIKSLPAKERQDFIWDKIIYANPIKDNQTLRELDPYKPLVTYDNCAEIGKVKKYAPHAGLVLRLKVPNTGAMVELSSKFGAAPGEAVDLIERRSTPGLVVEGLSFHVGSQCTNFENYVQALNLAAGIFHEAWDRGHPGGEAARHRRRLPGAVRRARQAVPHAGQDAQRRVRPAVPEGHRDPGRAGAVPGGHRRHRWWPASSARPCATASGATTSTTACTTRFRASSSTTASTT